MPGPRQSKLSPLLEFNMNNFVSPARRMLAGMQERTGRLASFGVYRIKYKRIKDRSRFLG